jgi:DMSO/TMAO reductase YedYZ molybdopterin-dependent catalytic subunit
MDAGSPPSAAEQLRSLVAEPPPGPTDPDFWDSPLRGPYLTAIVGSILLVGITIVAATGFLSHLAYEPDLRGNAIIPVDRDLPFPFSGWPSGPTWLYALNQGLHTNIGLATIPILAFKLWSVIPRLFAWPPVRSPAQALERLSIALLVGSALFEFVTGVLNFQYWYPFGFNFVVAHYYGGIVFVVSVLLHLVVKVPGMRRAFRVRGGLRPLLQERRPEDVTVDPVDLQDEPGLVPTLPREATITRRGAIAVAGAASGTLLAVNVGQSIGGPLRDLAILAPRREVGPGAQGFPVNKTFAASRIEPSAVGAAWRLELRGPGGRVEQLSREELLAMPQTTEELIIACVEGWSTRQTWTGVRVRDLGARVGVPEPSAVFVKSLQEAILGKASLSGDSARDERSLLALRVNGEDLSPDHGFPARIICPALPGVHCTKWVGRMEFSA